MVFIASENSKEGLGADKDNFMASFLVLHKVNAMILY